MHATDRPEDARFGKSKPDRVRSTDEAAKYCPASKFPQISRQTASELDMREFPGEVDVTLAEQIEAFERRFDTTLTVYNRQVREGPLQLCQVVESDNLDKNALLELRTLEESFGVWIVAYGRSSVERPRKGLTR